MLVTEIALTKALQLSFQTSQYSCSYLFPFTFSSLFNLSSLFLQSSMSSQSSQYSVPPITLFLLILLVLPNLPKLVDTLFESSVALIIVWLICANVQLYKLKLFLFEMCQCSQLYSRCTKSWSICPLPAYLFESHQPTYHSLASVNEKLINISQK